jgi:SAM-dependent methyltransferase
VGSSCSIISLEELEFFEKKKMKQLDYQDYYKSHYKSSLSVKDIQDYEKWFYAQWRFIKDSIRFKKNANVLEIGSGLGGFYKIFSNEIKHKSYLGLELDGEACGFASSFLGKKLFKHISFEDFTAKKGTYDYIFAFEVLEHLHSPKEAIEKMYSLLKPGGIFIGTSPYPFAKNIFADETHLFVLHPTNWERLFKLQGFKKIQHKPMSYLPFVWRLNKHLNRRIPIYLPFSQFISTTLLIAKK